MYGKTVDGGQEQFVSFFVYNSTFILWELGRNKSSSFLFFSLPFFGNFFEPEG